MPRIQTWNFTFANGAEAAKGTQGPFYELEGEVLFPESVQLIGAMAENPSAPKLRVTLAIIDGVPACTELTFLPSTEGASIKSPSVKEVNVGDAITQAVLWQAASARSIVDIMGGTSGPGGTYVFARDDSHDTERAARQLRRRQEITPARLRRVAEVYLANPSSPTAAVADEEDTSLRNASRLVSLAREQGLLPAYQRGTTEEGN